MMTMWMPSIRQSVAIRARSARIVWEWWWLDLCTWVAEWSRSIEMISVPPAIRAISAPPPVPAHRSLIVHASWGDGVLAWVLIGTSVEEPGLGLM